VVLKNNLLITTLQKYHPMILLEEWR